MRVIDTLFLFAMLSIWILLIVNIVLLYFGYKYSIDVEKRRFEKLRELKEYPFVSIMIPAHNEEVVIERTLYSMINLNYPKDKYEIIIINDNSKDNTGKVIENIKLEYSNINIKHVEVIGERGGKGKSNALNIGYEQAIGEYIVIYDADNTPNGMALRYLVNEITSNPNYGAVIGKFRTRNKEKNMLTKFINIETLSFQWMAQAGRWKLFKLCTIPGTNFILRRSIIDEIGGWDTSAIAEDTEISFRIYEMGYKIAFMPLAETFEQEPETVKVWLKQRSRWVNGNIYVLVKNLKKLHKIKNAGVYFDLFYFFSVYFLFLSSILISDAIFLLGIFTDLKIEASGNYALVWVLSYMVFLLQVSITLSFEKGEIRKENIFLVSIMYFTYCQLWIVVSMKGFWNFIKDTVLKRKSQWYKTERF